MKLLKKAAFGVIAVAMAGLAFAGHGDKSGKHQDWMAKKLDLTSEQRSQIKQIRQDKLAETKGLRDSMVEVRGKLHALIGSDNYSQDVVMQLAAEKADLQRQLTVQKISTWHAISQLLSAEQREKAKAMHERRAQKKHKGKHKRHHSDDSEL